MNSRTVSQFRALHEDGCFVMPNPWDAGSARFLEHAGFKALATTSAGFAFTLGLPDDVSVLSRDAVLQHARSVVSATQVPVSVDFQSGYGRNADEVRENAKRCAETGAAGMSIEDSTGDAGRPLFELSEAVERMHAAREGADASSEGLVLTGRAECFLVGKPDLDDVIRRLQAYSEAGADCLFAPGLDTSEQIRTVVAAVSPKPVNVLISHPIGLTVGDVAESGARRISVGSSLARVAWGGFMKAARDLVRDGRFDALGSAASFDELNGLFEVG